MASRKTGNEKKKDTKENNESVKMSYFLVLMLISFYHPKNNLFVQNVFPVKNTNYLTKTDIRIQVVG